MNIIELAQECKLVGEHPHLAGIYLQSLERFAKLIVQECIDILDDEDDEGPDGRSARIAAIRIKKLFGVKE
jgi:hypothetical protein